MTGLCFLGASPQHVQYAKKKPVLAYELFLKYGGEGDCYARMRIRPVMYANPIIWNIFSDIIIR